MPARIPNMVTQQAGGDLRQILQIQEKEIVDNGLKRVNALVAAVVPGQTATRKIRLAKVVVDLLLPRATGGGLHQKTEKVRVEERVNQKDEALLLQRSLLKGELLPLVRQINPLALNT